MPDPATVEQVRTRFPLFADPVSFPDARIQLALDDAVLSMGKPKQWGNIYALAQSYLAAHFLARQVMAETSSGATTGSATGISVQNEISLQFSTLATAKTSDDPLLSTIYGQEYVKLRRRVVGILAGVAP